MNGPPLVSVKNLEVTFNVRGGLFTPNKIVRAVDGVSFDIQKGEILALVVSKFLLILIN